MIHDAGRRGLRVVTPFRPFAPESREHLALGPFDWPGAIAMLRESVRRSNQCETVTITDAETTVPGPMFQYATRESRLMLWILEVSLCYLAGPHFDRDTVMISPDSLVFCDLRPWFAGDIGMVVRPDHRERPLLNGLQWWPLEGRDKLVHLHERALAMAKQLPDDVQTWGADTVPFLKLLKPLYAGCGPRKSGIVANLVESRHVLHPLTSQTIAALETGGQVDPPPAVVDFRFLRKQHMRAYYDATIGRVAA